MPIPLKTWFLPRPSRSKYPGSFPKNFETKLHRLLGRPPKVLQPFGGKAELGDRVDLNPEVKPDFLADAHDLHFIKDGTYDLVLLDPPYSDELNAELYPGKVLERPLKFWSYMSEAFRVCRPGGYIAMYHQFLTPRPRQTKTVYIISIITRYWHSARVCSVYRKLKSETDNADQLKFKGVLDE